MADSWVAETWWRDWLFRVGVVAGTANFGAGLTDDGDVPWWGHALRWAFAFAVVVVLFGFVRVVVRTYRAPTPPKE